MDIEALYFEALLAQAAYADGLEEDMTGERLAEKLMAVEGMTTAQAEYFASRYKVVVQEPTTDSGFSATVFQRISDDSLHFAMRGTDGLIGNGADWLGANYQNATYGMSYMQVADMLNFYLRLTNTGEVPQFKFTEVSESQLLPGQIGYVTDVSAAGQKTYLVFELFGSEPGLGNGTLNQSSQFVVSGHSLGGHLASVFSLLLPDYTVTFDSAGFIGSNFNELALVVASGINAANGIINMNPVESSNTILNIRAPLDPVSLLGSHLGGIVDVFIEAEDTITDLESHELDRLVDSLAVINLLNTLDNTVTLEKANQLLLIASNRENTSLEGIMSHLAKLFGQDAIARVDSDHNDIYKVIDQIIDNLGDQTYQIYAITGSIVDQALADDKAALYALINLQPFVVRGTTQEITDALYQSHSTNGALDAESYTEQYLADRAAMLQYLIEYNEKNTDYGDHLGVGGLAEDITYTDLSSPVNGGLNLELKIDSGLQLLPPQQIKFGTEWDDGISGDVNDDRLYGRGGVDFIHGNGGDDYIDGGKGNDHMFGGDGNDIYLVDSQDDVIIENAGEGEADIIKTSVDYTLTAQDKYIEQVELDTRNGGSGLNLTGDEFNNRLIGNQLDNILLSGGGNDILSGGEGNDTLYSGDNNEGLDRTDYDNSNVATNTTLYGGLGNDTYFISQGGSYEVIVDSDGLGEVYLAIDGINDKSVKITGGVYQYDAKRAALGFYDYYIEFDEATENKTGLEGIAFTLIAGSDGNNTLAVGNGLFQIQEYYQSDLGITLATDADGRGWNGPKRADIDNVIDAIVFDEAFDPSDVVRIKEAIKNAYEQSATARKMLTDFVSAGNAININFAPFDFFDFLHNSNDELNTENLLTSGELLRQAA